MESTIGNLPADFLLHLEAELSDFRACVARFDWRVAKTFEDFSPHQYILNLSCWKLKKDGKRKGRARLAWNARNGALSLKNGFCSSANKTSAAKC